MIALARVRLCTALMPSVRSVASAGLRSHRECREQLATLYRLLAAHRLAGHSGLNNHISMSVPTKTRTGTHYNNFLVIRFGLQWIEVTSENLLLVDSEGKVLEGDGKAQPAAVAVHGPIHNALGAGARVIMHTHQSWWTALACLKEGGLRMFHPDACAYYGKVGFDPVYDGNHNATSGGGARGQQPLLEGERLLGVPELQNKSIGFLANHGSLQIAASVEEAFHDCYTVEKLAARQIQTMHNTTPLRELTPRMCEALVQGHQRMKEQVSNATFARALATAPQCAVSQVSGLNRSVGSVSGQANQLEHRLNVAAACRSMSRLNGYETFVGPRAQISMQLDCGRFLVVPMGTPFSMITASSLLLCDGEGTLVHGEGSIDSKKFRALQQVRTAEAEHGSEYACVLHVRTRWSEQLAQIGGCLRPLSQTSFTFCNAHVGFYDGHASSFSWADGALNLTRFFADGSKMLALMPDGAVVVRGECPAHCFALLHSFDAAAEIQVKAQMSGATLLELPMEQVRAFPPHGYGDITRKTERMDLYFNSMKRTLCSGWNQGFHDTNLAQFAE